MANTRLKVEEEQAQRNAPARPVRGPVALPDHDVRRKKPALLSFILRADTARRMARVLSLLAVDFAGVWLAIFTALGFKAAYRQQVHVGDIAAQTHDIVAFAYLVTALLFARSSLYADRAQRPGFPRIAASLTQVAAVALVFAVVNGDRFSSYYIFYGSLFFGLVYVGVLRHGYELITGRLLRAAGYRRRTMLVGSGKQIEAVAHALRDAGAAIELVGYISLTPRRENGLRSLGTIDRLPEVLDANRLDEIIIADPDFPQDETVELVDQCHRRGLRVRIAPSTMEVLIHRAEFVPGASVPLFELTPPVFEGVDFAVKRSFDIVGSTLLLVFGAPVVAAIALGIKLTSRGSVFYRSWRPGIAGTPFACLKFRTMRSDADESQLELEELNEASGALFKIREDPRITRFGSFLRRFSLDELPQLINVLKGEMSLVGPRPLPQRDFDRLEEWHKKRYLVLPGMTGLWQVSGRSDLDFDDLVRLDFLYLERWSVFLDLAIIVRTLPAVLRRRGAF
jgi:exopolysaccharide biosynthesis polyprenyl glycosylphosphotransferase